MLLSIYNHYLVKCISNFEMFQVSFFLCSILLETENYLVLLVYQSFENMKLCSFWVYRVLDSTIIWSVVVAYTSVTGIHFILLSSQYTSCQILAGNIFLRWQIGNHIGKKRNLSSSQRLQTFLDFHNIISSTNIAALFPVDNLIRLERVMSRSMHSKAQN